MPFPVTCPACGKSFSISDEIYEQKIKGRIVSVKCKQCQSAIRVDGTKGTLTNSPPGSPGQSPEPTPERPANEAPPADQKAQAVEPPPAAPAPAAASAAASPKLGSARGATGARSPIAARSAVAAPAVAPAPAPLAEPALPMPPQEAAAVVAPTQAAPTAVAALPEEGPVLFAVDSADGSDRELTAEQIGAELLAGTISPETLVWRDGMAEWLEIKKVPDLASYLKKPEPKPEASKVSGGKGTAAAAGRFRPRQPTLPMGAIPGPTPSSTKEAPRATDTATAKGKTPVDTKVAPVAAARGLSGASAPDSRRDANKAGGGPLGFGNVPRAPSNTPIPSDDEPTVLRTPEAVAALISASTEEHNDDFTPVPARLGTQRTNNKANAQAGTGGLPPLPARGAGLATPSGAVARGRTELGLGRSLNDGRPTPAPPLPSVGTTTQQLGTFTMPGGSPPPPSVSAAPGSQKVPTDTFRESPEAKRAWFPEQASSSVPPPPAPPPAAPAPRSPPAPPPLAASSPFAVGASNPFTAGSSPFSTAGLPTPPNAMPAPAPAPAGLHPPPLTPVAIPQQQLPNAMIPQHAPASTPGLTAPHAPSPFQVPTRPLDDEVAFKPKRRRALWIVLALLLVAGAAVAAFVLLGVPKKAPPPPPPVPVAEAPRPVPTATATTAPEPAAPTATGAAAPTEAPSEAGTQSTQAAAEPAATGPPNGDFADLFAAGAKRAAGSGDRFDPKVGRAALDALMPEAARCRERGGPTGQTRVTVTFAPDGRVHSAVVEDAPIAGTSTAVCVSDVVKRAVIPAFVGAAASISQRVIVP